MNRYCNKLTRYVSNCLKKVSKQTDEGKKNNKSPRSQINLNKEPKTTQPKIQANQVIKPQTWKDTKIEKFIKLDQCWYPNLVDNENVPQKLTSNSNSLTELKSLNHSVEYCG